MKLTVTNLSKSYYDDAVLNGINYTFENGKIYGIIGKNGAGKTTFFNCLSGDIEYEDGQANLSINSTNRVLTKADVGYVTSLPILPEFLTGYEFIKIMLDVQNISLDIKEAFNIVRLNKNEQHKLIKNYSHGMKNKLQMLCFILGKAPVIFLDEPLTSLDVVVAREIKEIIRTLKHDRIIIFSTHILPLAVELCDELIILNNGKFSTLDSDKLLDKTFEDEVISMLETGESHENN